MAKKPKEEAGKAVAKSPESQPAWDAFERGDFRSARKLARSLLAGGAPEPAKEDAREILGRTGLEKGTLASLLILAAVIAGIIVVLATR